MQQALDKYPMKTDTPLDDLTDMLITIIEWGGV